MSHDSYEAFDTLIGNNPALCCLAAKEVKAKEKQAQQASKALQIFENTDFGCVRACMKDGQIWFVARDVCSVLGLKNTAMALSALDADEKTTVSSTYCNNDFNGLRADTKLVTESGMYALVLRSKKEEARKFRKWITSEVIPALREHGFYGVPQNSIVMPDFTQPDVAAEAWAQQYREKQAALERANVLEECIGIAESWKQINSLSWVPQFFRTSNPAIWQLLGKQAVKMSKQLGFEVRKAPDSTYGEVNVYNVDVLKALRHYVQTDKDFLASYRKR